MSPIYGNTNCKLIKKQNKRKKNPKNQTKLRLKIKHIVKKFSFIVNAIKRPKNYLALC